MQKSFIKQVPVPSRGMLHACISGSEITPEGIERFHNVVYSYYNQHKRSFVWRETLDPYHIVVSEIMLQQTQTERVKEKFIEFTQAFPSFKELAEARLSDVLFYWQGLGYNRRALYLHQAAQTIMDTYDGKLPKDPQLLRSFKGIGPNTAGSICAFAFNMPTVFIETNIRTVFIHLFYTFEEMILDIQLIHLIAQAVDIKQPREWYYALMDYGVMLKKNLPNPSRRSAHHTVQSKFEGSDRQLRARIVRLLLEHGRMTEQMLIESVHEDVQRIRPLLIDLVREGLLGFNEFSFFIP